MITKIEIKYAEQSLYEYLEENQEHVEKYLEQVEQRMQKLYPQAEISVTTGNVLTDKFHVETQGFETYIEVDEAEADAHGDWTEVENEIQNDWSFLDD